MQQAESWPMIQLAISELARATWSATGPRPASNLSATSFEQVRAILMSRQLEPARSWLRTGSKPNSITLSGRRQVRSWSRTCRRPAIGRVSSLLDDRSNFSSLQVCDQLRTCLRPDNVVEFGFYAIRFAVNMVFKMQLLHSYLQFYDHNLVHCYSAVLENLAQVLNCLMI